VMFGSGPGRIFVHLETIFPEFPLGRTTHKEPGKCCN